MQDWTSRTYEFKELERYAHQFRRTNGIVRWLKTLGIIPYDCDTVKPSQVKLELDPKAIKAGYLASVAYEWDSWGDSSPLEFMEALRCELKGSSQRDAIANALLALGRTVNTEWT